MLLLKTYKCIEELIYKAFYNHLKKQSFLNLSNADGRKSIYLAAASTANLVGTNSKTISMLRRAMVWSYVSKPTNEI